MVTHDGGAHSGTIAADLAAVVEAWHAMDAATRALILKAVAQAVPPRPIG